MAEFKNVFIKSKMNKDLDDRLLPQGEYRDALNIQVSKSESSDVGALENVLGNKKLINFDDVTGNANVVCVGYLVSEVNSCVFFFLTDNTLASNPSGKYSPSSSNFIVRSLISEGTATQNAVLVQGAFLNFWEGNPIYGVNLLEDLLFFTDNRNQPRKINVQSALNDPTYYTIEDTISVAKYMPYNAPILWQEVTASIAADFQPPYTNQGIGEYQTTMQDVVSEKYPDETPSPVGEFQPYYDDTYRGDPDYLEDKFVRFSYRFKFDDGEYSVFAPFTQECFIPKQDGYFLLNSGAVTTDENDMSAAYRSTIVDFMENKVNQLTLLIDMPVNGDPAFPATTLLNVTDYFKITEIEILFKESDGLAVLVVDTISADEIKAQQSPLVFPQTNTFKYTYSGTKPFRTLPEDQTTRVYDKVPVKALSQELISNRVVYGNFQTKHTPPSTISYNVGTQAKGNFDVTTPVTSVEWRTSIVEYPNHTLKQNRNYQAGFVLSDRFGRTTSTLLSNAAGSSTGIISSPKLSTVYSPYNDGTVDAGAWPGDALYVQVNETIDETPVKPTLYPGTYVGDPTLLSYNPLGFDTWKIVVKQQEQDYYNVYLPGILAAYPEAENRELGVTSHVVLFNDNVNKVPRDLAEVGPDQKQFRSSVQLFGRVENTLTAAATSPTTLGLVNKQYYPLRFSDTVVTISNMFDLFNLEPGSVNLGDYEFDFYEAESNPLIGRISTQKQIGQETPQNPNQTSIQNLAIYETEPVESKLDIYWETSTSGKIDDLNTQVIETGGQTIFGIVNFDWNVTEYWGIQTPASIPWDPAVLGSPEPGTLPTTPTSGNGFLGRFRSVIGGNTDDHSQFWFDDVANQPIQNVTLHEFSVINGNGDNVTSDFDLLQIYGTASTVAGPGTYTNYKGAQGTAYAHDTFILVNKTYKLYTTEDQQNGFTDFYITIKVSDNANDPDSPIRTFTLVNDITLDNLNTIHVGAKQLKQPLVEFGQVAQPIQNYLDPAPLPPAAGIFFEYGDTTGNLVQFFAMNGANQGNPLITPSQNQTGLVWSIASQEQPSGTAVNIFQIDSATGMLTEVEPGQGLGKFEVVINVQSGDGTSSNFNILITIGRKTATGSFSNNIRGYTLNYDNAYLFNLHGTEANAYNQLPSAASQDIDTHFTYTYPDIGNIPLPGLNEFYTNTASGGYTYGAGNFQKLNVVQPTGANPSPFEGALTQGTGYINIEMYLQGLSSSASNDYQTSEISWAVEYREITPSVGDWKPATDIEGNVLSWNTGLTGTTTPVTNPQQSGLRVDGEGSGTQPGGSGGFSLSRHKADNSQSTSNTKQKYGAAVSDTISGDTNDPRANSVQYQAEKQYGSNTVPEIYLGRWVAVGESFVYGVASCLGEYRVIIQNIGGVCTTCQSEIANNPESVSQYSEAGVINIGDFYYDLRPVNSSRAFGYEVDINVFPDTAQGKDDALDNNFSNPTILYAEEGVNRYVSQFYLDTELTTPFTGWIGSGDGYISYRATENSTAGYNIPYSINVPDPENPPDSNDAITPALAAENAASEGGVPATSQNKRLWACRINTTNGLKYPRTSVGKSGD
jgi:hypothetical protein